MIFRQILENILTLLSMADRIQANNMESSRNSDRFILEERYNVQAADGAI